MQSSKKHQSRIQWFSQQIQINPQDTNLVLSRSNQYVLEGRINEAVSDCSKLIMISPTRQLLAKRSRLFKQQGMFSLALQDLAEASCLQKDNNDETAVDIYLSNSICIKSIKEASEMASIVEEIKQKIDVTSYTHTLNELLHIKDLQIQKIKMEKESQINRIKKQYQNQTNSLKEMLMVHLIQLKEKINLNIQNYEEKFLKRLGKLQLTDKQNQKMRIYFQNVSSEMEKYYVAAKNLHKIDDKSIKFQDFQNIIVCKNKPDILRVIYKFFDSYSDKIEKIISLIQNVPYIGTVFNVLKATMKAQGWIQQINIENQCHNIEKIAFNITSFNQFSTNLAFFLSFHFQSEILAEHPKYKSQWWQLVEKIKQIKRESIGKNGYKKPVDPQMDVVKDYAVIHASIIMVAYACNCLRFTRQDLKIVNKNYEEGMKVEQTDIRKIFKIIQQIELGLKKNIKQQTPIQTSKGEKSYCKIY